MLPCHCNLIYNKMILYLKVCINENYVSILLQFTFVSTIKTYFLLNCMDNARPSDENLFLFNSGETQKIKDSRNTHTQLSNCFISESDHCWIKVSHFLP